MNTDYLTLLAISIAGVGLILNFWQIRKSNLQKRAEFLTQIHDKFSKDEIMFNQFYKIEYGEFEYTNNFHGSDEEKDLDHLLGYFDMIGKLYDIGLLTIRDLKFFEYEFKRISNDTEIAKYLSFLDHVAQAMDLQGKFIYLRKVSKLF